MTAFDPAAFLEDSAERQAWSWEASNCLLLLADWIDLKRGTDLGARWRGRRLDERGVRREIKVAGGFLPFMEREAALLGLDRIDPAEARDGDVGAIRVSVTPRRMVGHVEIGRRGETGERRFRDRIVTIPVGALRLGDAGGVWGVRTQSGCLAAAADAIAAWRV